jgi:ABC-type polysaccharide/polyol phosphate export permease
VRDGTAGADARHDGLTWAIARWTRSAASRRFPSSRSIGHRPITVVIRDKFLDVAHRRVSALADLRASRDLLVNLTQREIKGKYKRTALGQVWSLLNPVAVMAMYAVVFAFVLRVRPEAGDPSGLDVFALWLACALLPWMFFNNVVTSGMGSIVGNANLIQKVYFPRETLVLSNSFSWLFTFAIEMAVLVLATLLFGGEPLLLVPVTIILMALLAAFATGIALLLAIANVYFRDTQHFVGILMQLWFYATPIVYPVSLVTESASPTVAALYRLNPMERFSEAFRNTIYDGRLPSLATTTYIVVVSLLTLVVGYVVFRRREGRLAEEL